jgi:hypothetical protein
MRAAPRGARAEVIPHTPLFLVGERSASKLARVCNNLHYPTRWPWRGMPP